MINETPKVTIYIASYNCDKFLQDAIESVLVQTYKNWELIIIDDNSIDNSWKIIQQYVLDKRIQVTKTTGLGLPGVCNLALGMAKGEFIVRLDGDDVLDENMLLVLANYLEQNPKDCLVYPDWYLMTEDGFVFSQERREKAYAKNQMHDIPPHGACTMFRTALLKEVGGYREDLGAQDGLDIWTKLIHKYSYGNTNLPLFYYRRHGQNLTNNQTRIFYSRLEIKREYVSEELKKRKPIIAIIPCREMYDFVPNFWDAKIDNKSLLECQLDLLTSIELFDHILVCSDTDKVCETLKKYKNDKRVEYFHRDTSLTYRSTPFSKCVRLILDKYDPELEGVSVVSYLESPFKSKNLVEESIFTLLMAGADSSIAVEEIKYPIYKRENSGLALVNAKNIVSSDIGRLYRELLTVNTFKNQIIKNGNISGNRVVNFLIPSHEGFCIVSPQALEYAKHRSAN